MERKQFCWLAGGCLVQGNTQNLLRLEYQEPWLWSWEPFSKNLDPKISSIAEWSGLPYIMRLFKKLIKIDYKDIYSNGDNNFSF